MIFLLIGPPASGKGTISKLLSQKTGLPIINVGKILRDIPKDSIWHQPIQEAMDKGELASNSIIGGFLDEITKDSRYENGYILDGWARQLSDLDHFDPRPDKVIFLNINFETSKKRIMSRRVCEKGEHTYNLISDPPLKEGVCDVDGSKLIKREDDSPEVLEHRWEIYRDDTLEVIDQYRDQGVLFEVDASAAPEEIFEYIENNLNL